MRREPNPFDRTEELGISELEPVQPPMPILLYGRPSKLRVAIARTGYHSYQIAAAAGINPMTLSRYVNRRRRISPTHLYSLAKVLSVDPEDILEDPLPSDWGKHGPR